LISTLADPKARFYRNSPVPANRQQSPARDCHTRGN